MLKRRIGVYVPSTRNVNQPLTQEEHEHYTDIVASKLSELFGGATAQNGKGYWLTNGNTVKENITVVTSYHDNPNALALVIPIAQWLKVELTQESVTIETEEGIEFI